MNRKFPVLPLLALALSLCPVSCRTAPDLYAIVSGQANIAYSASRDATFLDVRFFVLSRNDVPARISEWRIVLKTWSRGLLEVNSGNYLRYAPFLSVGELAPLDVAGFFLQSNNPLDDADSRPFPGRLFSGSVPDNMDVFLTIVDAGGRTAGAEQHLLVWYSTIP